MARKTKKKIKSIQPNIDISKIIAYFLTTLISLGIIFNGYFFEYQSLTVNILTGAFFIIILVIFYKTNTSLYLDKKIFFLTLFFLIINIVGLFYASNLRDALSKVLLLMNTLIIYILSSQAFNVEKNATIFFRGLYSVSVFVAGLSLASYIFGINILNTYPITGNRIYSTLGYPNTAALLFVLTFFSGFWFQHISNNKQYIYLFSNSILFQAFLGTKSRGVLLLFPILIIIYILLQNKENRKKSINNLFFVLVLNIILFPFIYFGTFNNKNLLEITIPIISIMILFTIIYFKNQIKINNKKTISILLIPFVIFILVLVNLNNDIFNNDIINRMKKIDLQQQSVQERLIFMQDAFKIVKDHPLLGVGSGGWNAEYRKYRSFLYFTSEVHNHYLQVLVENGVLGFVIFIILWIVVFLNIYKAYRLRKDFLIINASIFIIGIFLHSLIDFDLTYPVFFMLLWILFAISSLNFSVKNDFFKYRFIVITVITLALVINSSLWLGWTFGSNAIKQMQRNEIPKAIEKFEKSLKFDPINATYLTNLAQLYFSKGASMKDDVYIKKAINTIDKALKYNPTNFEWHIVKTRMLVYKEQYEEAYKIAQKAISRAPLEEVVYFDTARFFIEKENPEALKYAKKIIGMAKNEGNKIKDNKYKKWWHGTKLSESSRLTLLEGRINLIEKKYSDAQLYFYQAVKDKDSKETATKFLQQTYNLSNNLVTNGEFNAGDLGWTLNGTGGERWKIIYNNNKYWLNIRKNDIITKWWGLNQLIYEFEPGKEYKLSFDAFSKREGGQIRLIIHQIGEDGINPQKSQIIKLDNNINNYSWTFKTDNINTKDRLRLHILVPNEAEKQNVLITNIKLTKVN